MEVRDHLTTALDAGYITEERWKELEAMTQRVIRVLNGYIRATRERMKPTKSKL